MHPENSTLLFLGDSLTAYYDWQSRFPAFTVYNSGNPGETAEGLLARLGMIPMREMDPDYVFLMTGTNNILMDDFGIKNIYRQIVNRLISECAYSGIVIQAIPPIALPWVSNEKLKSLNGTLGSLAGEFNVRFLPIFQLLTDSRGKVRSGFLEGDGVHLSGKGYEIWSGAVEEMINHNQAN